MRAIKIDLKTREPILKNSRFEWVTGIDAVLQNCEQSMRQQIGELQYNQTKGVEYLNNVFSGNPNYQAFEFQARREIEKVQGVTRVEDFSYLLSEGVLSYTATIKTIFGKGAINGSL